MENFEKIYSLYVKDTNWARVTFYRGKCKLVEMIKEDEL